MMRALSLLCCLILAAQGFQPTTVRNIRYYVGSKETEALPFTQSSCALRMALKDDKNVKVNLLPEVDAFTLTAVGFGLIAFNFLVLGNMGDLGIGGVVARIINTFG